MLTIFGSHKNARLVARSATSLPFRFVAVIIASFIAMAMKPLGGPNSD
jgi:hypothetical protein